MNYPYNNPYTYNGYTPQIQTQQQQSGFIGVQNEYEARTYPLAVGHSATFRDESQPNTFYTKTMGNSPLDRPTFECYRLVKVETAENATQPTETAVKEKDIDLSAYALKDDLRAFEDVLAVLKKDIAVLKDRTKKKVVREVDYDDAE